ncbi:hypothetical protein ACFV84_29715 [Kitasatospora sp. NPDC059811]|uniref:hypothetical protein n=1 Tax=Streptomycetaceae TaxID=2062 RepID=UPI0007AF4042|nr:hypothetical protein [Streptomyces sp. MJM8645]
MTAPAPGADGQSGRPRTAQHYSVTPTLDSPEGYVAPGMPGVPVAGYVPTVRSHRTGPRRRTALAVALAVLAMLLGGLAYGCAPARAADSLGWLAIALAALVALPLGRLGGRSRVLPLLGALLAACALLLGQLTGQLRRVHAAGPGPRGLPHDALAHWRAELRALDLAFYGIALVGGFLLTRRTANRG